MQKKKVVFIVGTTASGKSDLAIKLAKIFNGEIISADSRQVYVGLDIGSGKVTKEEQAEAKHHLLDILEPNVRYSAMDFQKDCYKKIDEIFSRLKNCFICGGSGFYTRSVVEGYGFSSQTNFKLREELEAKSLEELQKMLNNTGIELNESDFQNKRRVLRAIELNMLEGTKMANNPKFEVLQLGVAYERKVLNERILTRLDARIKEGMLEEIQGLLDKGTSPDFLKSLGLEYRYTTMFLLGELTFEEFHLKLFSEIKHFAKRQQTWFKKEKNIVWLDTSKDCFEEAKILVEKFLNN